MTIEAALGRNTARRKWCPCCWTPAAASQAVLATTRHLQPHAASIRSLQRLQPTSLITELTREDVWRRRVNDRQK